MAKSNIGRMAWHELASPDPVAATKFYTELLGWGIREMDMGPDGTYRMLMKGDVPVGGAMKAPPGVPAHWLSYVGGVDADASAKKIAELGGKILVPPTSVPGMVRFTVATDPQGAAFGVLQDISGRPEAPIGEGPPVPGTFCWDELHTKDPDAAAKWYGQLFGWTTKVSDGPMKYLHVVNDGADIGGMMASPMPNVPSNWLAYLAIADVDAGTAKVKTLGGKVIVEPQNIEKVGKFSIVADPTGAVFALFRSARV